MAPVHLAHLVFMAKEYLSMINLKISLMNYENPLHIFHKPIAVGGALPIISQR